MIPTLPIQRMTRRQVCPGTVLTVALIVALSGFLGMCIGVVITLKIFLPL